MLSIVEETCKRLSDECETETKDEEWNGIYSRETVTNSK